MSQRLVDRLHKVASKVEGANWEQYDELPDDISKALDFVDLRPSAFSYMHRGDEWVAFGTKRFNERGALDIRIEIKSFGPNKFETNVEVGSKRNTVVVYSEKHRNLSAAATAASNTIKSLGSIVDHFE